MTNRPHDALFKAAFEQVEHAGGLFRSVLPASICAAVSWPTMARESGSFIDPELGDRHSDLLFSVQVRGAQAYLYLLLEHQSTSDASMPLRMLIYLARIFERHRKDNPGRPLPLIVPVLVSHAPGGWTAPTSLHALFNPDPASIPGLAELVPNYSMVVLDLAHLSNEELKSRALDAFPELALWALRDIREFDELLRNLDHFASTFQAALRSPNGMGAVTQLLRYVALLTDKTQAKQFRAKLRQQAPEAEEAMVTYGEELIEQGRQEGQLKGRQEGQINLLEKLLTLKFGAVPADHKAQLEAATEAQLGRYAERVLTAESLDAVFADAPG